MAKIICVVSGLALEGSDLSATRSSSLSQRSTTSWVEAEFAFALLEDEDQDDEEDARPAADEAGAFLSLSQILGPKLWAPIRAVDVEVKVQLARRLSPACPVDDPSRRRRLLLF